MVDEPSDLVVIGVSAQVESVVNKKELANAVGEVLSENDEIGSAVEFGSVVVYGHQTDSNND